MREEKENSKMHQQHVRLSESIFHWAHVFVWTRDIYYHYSEGARMDTRCYLIVRVAFCQFISLRAQIFLFLFAAQKLHKRFSRRYKNAIFY